jgi:hypothetical protein
MAEQTRKKVRSNQNRQSQDPSSIALLSYNNQTGAQKNMEMGHHLVPIQTGTATYTTDASTLRAIPMGVTLAIYNPTAGALSATLSKNNAATLLAVGATNAEGDVGMALAPNSYTYVASFDKDRVITSGGVYTYIVADDTIITDQAQVR